MKYIYWDNKNETPTKMLEVIAEDISTADDIFEKETGFKPVKNTWIGCSIEKLT